MLHAHLGDTRSALQQTALGIESLNSVEFTVNYHCHIDVLDSQTLQCFVLSAALLSRLLKDKHSSDS